MITTPAAAYHYDMKLFKLWHMQSSKPPITVMSWLLCVWYAHLRITVVIIISFYFSTKTKKKKRNKFSFVLAIAHDAYVSSNCICIYIYHTSEYCYQVACSTMQLNVSYRIYLFSLFKLTFLLLLFSFS